MQEVGALASRQVRELVREQLASLSHRLRVDGTHLLHLHLVPFGRSL